MLLYRTIAPIIGIVYPITINMVMVKKIEKYINGYISIFFFLKKIKKRKRTS